MKPIQRNAEPRDRERNVLEPLFERLDPASPEPITHVIVIYVIKLIHFLH